MEIDGASGYGTTEKEGLMVVTTRGDIPLGTEEKFDVVTIEFSPMGNITLSCENEVPRNLSVRFHRWEGFQWAISVGRFGRYPLV